jgi:carbonic anhydrase
MKKLFLITAFFTQSLSFAETVAPKEALNRLVQGNTRYQTNLMIHPNRGYEVRQKLKVSQTPFAVILGCSDSRVPPEIVFDQGIGDLFIVRVAGNILGETELESLKFSTEYLQCSLIMVLGHHSCGAVNAVMQGKAKEFKAIDSYLKEVCEKAYPDVDKATILNVKKTVKALKSHPAFKLKVDSQKMDVVGAYYDLDTGKVSILSED